LWLSKGCRRTLNEQRLQQDSVIVRSCMQWTLQVNRRQEDSVTEQRLQEDSASDQKLQEDSASEQRAEGLCD
jgi:hypothetical protein